MRLTESIFGIRLAKMHYLVHVTLVIQMLWIKLKINSHQSTVTEAEDDSSLRHLSESSEEGEAMLKEFDKVTEEQYDLGNFIFNLLFAVHLVAISLDWVGELLDCTERY